MKNKKTRRIIILFEVILLIILAVIAIKLGTGSVLNRNTEKQTETDSGADEEDVMYYNGQAYSPKTNIETVLFMGIDKYENTADENSGYNNQEQADWIMLMVFNHDDDTWQKLFINRDTMTDIPVLDVNGDEANRFTGQLALAHTYGSGGKDSDINMKKAVSGFLYGITIDHYICLTMEAIGQINDMAGGVPVTVMDDMTAMDPDLVQGSNVLLNASQSEIYVRGRGGLAQPTNTHRMERQEQYLDSLQKQLLTRWNEDSSFSLNVLEGISESMTSDCTINRLNKIAEKCRDYEDAGNLSIEGKSVKGDVYMEFYPDEDKLMELVLQLFYDPVTQ